MNQRWHLLALARKGDQKAINQLMELYQVRVYSGDSLKSLKIRKSLPVLSHPKSKETTSPSRPKPAKKHKVVAKKLEATPKAARPAASKAASPSPKSSRAKTKGSAKVQTRPPKPARKSKVAQSSPKKVSRKVSSKQGVKKKQGATKKRGTR